MLEEASDSVLVYVPEKAQVRPRVFSSNSQIVDEIEKAVSEKFPKSLIDSKSTIDLGDNGREVEFHKLENADRAIGLYIITLLVKNGWESVELVSVAQLQGYTTHILHRMEKRTRTT